MDQHESPSFFIQGPSPFSRLVLFAALSISLMATDSRLHYLNEIRQGFIVLLHPFQLIANIPSNAFRSASEYFISQKTLRNENSFLKEQALYQNSELQKLGALKEENDNLRKLLGTAKSSSQPVKLAEIMYMGRDPFTHRIIINLGSRDGVEAGQAVIDSMGVIGQITRTYPFSSEVTLLTDKDLAIPIQIERNSLRAIAFGHGRDNTIDLPYLPGNVDIRKGDKLVTSGIDGIYPTGLAVAEVVDIQSNPNSPFAHIVCNPIAGIENHRQVLVIGFDKRNVDLENNIESNLKAESTPLKSNSKRNSPPKSHATH